MSESPSNKVVHSENSIITQREITCSSEPKNLNKNLSKYRIPVKIKKNYEISSFGMNTI